MRRMDHDIGERVLVSHKDRSVRGWLERADDVAVVVRLPSLENPEAPGEELATFPCPPPPKFVTMVTCTSVYDHYGIMIGYLDPTWAKDEESARRFAKFVLGLATKLGAKEERLEKMVQHDLRVRKISLAVPLQNANIWNDHGRMAMHEQAKRELASEAAT